MTINLFGFEIEKTKPVKGHSPIPPSGDEPSIAIAGGFSASYNNQKDPSKQEFEHIIRYRQMSLHPEVDSAIDEIINEFVVTDVNEPPVEINLEKLKISEKLKKIISEEFQYILRLLDFENKAFKIIRSWYIDGKIFYHNVIDLENPKDGIQELRYIDSLKLKKRKIKISKLGNYAPILGITLNPQDLMNQNWKLFYEYSPNGFLNSNHYNNGESHYGSIPFALDSITTSVSGLHDLNSMANIGYLHKAIKALNQLRHQEDAIVIYRISRGPERRAFYIDTGNLPRNKAEQQLRETAANVRQQISYNSETGEIVEDKKHMSILEDFFLPRRDGKTSTEITTLPAGQNLGELKDVEYFRKKLYNSLNLPPSRLTDDNKGFNLGKSNEILRDELKFSKFIGRLRKDFSRLFINLLRVQLILKNVVTVDEWEEIKNYIQFDWLHDNHFNELKAIEMMNMRMDVIAKSDPFVGRYLSVGFIRRHILNQSETDIKEIDKEMKKEGIPFIDIEKEQLAHSMEMDKESLEVEKKAIKAKDTSSSPSK